ncbi:MAG: hypothetical protein ABIQ55_06845 [Gemmatimonadaceae bacterium]
MTEPVPFACDMTAIPLAERDAHFELARRLSTETATDVRSEPDSLTFVFPASAYDAMTRFVASERLCCPFLEFFIDVLPQQGPISLRLSGPPGAAAFLRAELGITET